MNKLEYYRAELRASSDWESYLRAESGLPGPRGNLELAQAAADEVSPEQIEQLLAYDAQRAPANTPDEFLAFCGTVALGRLLAEGNDSVLPRLKALANDSRWRTREAVAMALQRLGDVDMDRLLESVRPWAQGSPLEQRALAAGICEPRLLRHPQHAQAVLELLDTVTRSIVSSTNRKTDDFQALKKGLGYCWSVAIAALPEAGKAAFEPWINNPDPDIRWIVRENLQKNRLVKMDPAWVEEKRSALSSPRDQHPRV